MQVVIYPGWASAPADWRAWLAFAPKEVTIHIADPGYFGAPTNQPNDVQPDLIIAHSYGAHCIHPDHLSSFVHVALIATFTNLLPPSAAARTRWQQMMLKTRTDLRRDWESTLRRFDEWCAYPYRSTPTRHTSACLYKLLQDHKTMEHSKLPLSRLQKAQQIHLFHGTKDRFSPMRHAHALRRSLPNSKLVTIEGAGHALPFTHAHQIMEHLFHTKPSAPKTSKTAKKAPTSSIQTGFQQAVHTYDQHATVQHRAAQRLLQQIQMLPLPTGAVLELGCGTGIFTHHLAKNFPHRTLHITDLCPHMVCHCCAQQMPHCDTQFYAQDASQLQTKAAYALITSNFVMQWVHNLVASWQRALRLLCPQGWLAGSLPIAGSFPEWQDACKTANVPFTANPLPTLETLQALGLARGSHTLTSSSSHGITSSLLHASLCRVPMTLSTSCLEQNPDNTTAINSPLCEKLGLVGTYDEVVSFPNPLAFFRSMKRKGTHTSLTKQHLSFSDFQRLLAAWPRTKHGTITATYRIALFVAQKSGAET